MRRASRAKRGERGGFKTWHRSHQVRRKKEQEKKRRDKQAEAEIMMGATWSFALFLISRSGARRLQDRASCSRSRPQEGREDKQAEAEIMMGTTCSLPLFFVPRRHDGNNLFFTIVFCLVPRLQTEKSRKPRSLRRSCVFRPSYVALSVHLVFDKWSAHRRNNRENAKAQEEITKTFARPPSMSRCTGYDCRRQCPCAFSSEWVLRT